MAGNMAQAFGIVTSSGSRIYVDGMQDYRPIGAFSFLGRYRVVDFPVSNLSNSGIDRIQVYVSQNPRSLAEHLNNGRTYNINPKHGKLQLLFNQDSRVNNIYNTDIRAYMDNMDQIEHMPFPYVVIVPGYTVFRQDFHKLLQDHIDSGADITFLYHKTDRAKTNYRGLGVITLNRQKGVKTIERNLGNNTEANIYMGTCVMKKDLFVSLVKKAAATSSIMSLSDIINKENEDLDIRAVQHKGYFASITDLKSYFEANLELLDLEKTQELISDDWPIYTVTTDSCPVEYFKGSKIVNSMVANGCQIYGQVENSVIGRGVIIAQDAVVKNCVVLGHSVIGRGVHLENQIVDKWARISDGTEIIAAPDLPGYIRRNDVL